MAVIEEVLAINAGTARLESTEPVPCPADGSDADSATIGPVNPDNRSVLPVASLTSVLIASDSARGNVANSRSKNPCTNSPKSFDLDVLRCWKTCIHSAGSPIDVRTRVHPSFCASVFLSLATFMPPYLRPDGLPCPSMIILSSVARAAVRRESRPVRWPCRLRRLGRP